MIDYQTTSLSKMAIVNQLWNEVVPINVSDEFHNSPDCHFVVRQLPARIIALNRTVYILIRVCVCNRYANKHHLSKTAVINWEEFIDGVELHLSSSCRYRPVRQLDGSVRHRRICKCPK